MGQPPLHAVSFLAPNMLPVYRFVLDYLSSELGAQIALTVGSDYGEALEADLTFICGLPYVLVTRPHFVESPIEALVAPVLQGPRFENRPIYFSDVIVHRDSPFRTFADLRGCSWAYYEPQSQSGYGITRYWLALRRNQRLLRQGRAKRVSSEVDTDSGAGRGRCFRD